MLRIQPSLMNTQDAALYLCLSPNTLSVWRSQGLKGPRYKKVGSRVRYSQSDLDQWLAEQTFEHTAKRASSRN